MSTIVAVMDRAGFAANTDILVLVQPEARRLLWVPRDLWCEALHDRINSAYAAGGGAAGGGAAGGGAAGGGAAGGGAVGGHARLAAALAEHGLIADHCLCLARQASEAALSSVRLLVPVPARMEFDYPLAPTRPIEEGSKHIVFNPPFEQLQGERIHQWLGARGGSDLHRLERQKVFLRRLMARGYDFRQFLANPAWVQCSSPAALSELAQARPDWAFDTLSDLQPANIDGKLVLVRAAPGTSRPSQTF